MELLSRGEVVGELTEVVPDMWYISGKFTAADSEGGRRFSSVASALDLRTAYSDYLQALRTTVRESPDDGGTLLIVMSLTDGELFGRRVFERDAVAWALAHVPE